MANDMLDMFIFENVQLTEQLENVLIEGEQLHTFTGEHINEIFRIMHTIKGSAAMMEFEGIATLGHKIEDMFFFIRENNVSSPDWDEIADICLGAVDYFKQEVAKIQAGQHNDGDFTELAGRIESYMNILIGADAPAAQDEDNDEDNDEDEDDIEDAEDDDDGDADSADPAPESSAGDGTYRFRVFFDPGCKMENVRSYQIANALADAADEVLSNPKDLLEDCSDQIIANGVEFAVISDEPAEVFESIIKGTLFVKSYEKIGGKSKSAKPEKAEKKTKKKPAKKAEAPSPAEPKPAPKAAASKKKKAPEVSATKPSVAPAAAPVGTAPPSTAAAPVGEVKQSFISVNVEKLDKLMDLMGEIVITVSMVVNSPDLEGLQLDAFEKASAQLIKNTGELQDVIMSVRMLPISSTFHKMSRIVRDTGKKLGKDAELVIIGEETEVDKNIIDNLSDPLMHIIRNSMDHGLEETRDERLDAGKNPTGRITLEARNSGSDVIISCSDDGYGLDRDKILNKARNNGLLTRPESDYTDKEIYQFIMLPGFSTNEVVTELSGRGVGMDVVKKNIEKVGGTVDLDSTPGQGMTVNIRIPLTLAILQSIEISVGKNNYLIPTLNIRESYKPAKENIIIDPDGNEMIMFRGECFNIVRLHRLFGVDTEVTAFEDGIVIMIEDDDRMTAVFADALVGEQQAVVKPIPNFITERIGQIYGISGCTLLGDGSISLIIDVKSLTQGS